MASDGPNWGDAVWKEINDAVALEAARVGSPGKGLIVALGGDPTTIYM
jgi:hypothetical protein